MIRFAASPRNGPATPPTIYPSRNRTPNNAPEKRKSGRPDRGSRRKANPLSPPRSAGSAGWSARKNATSLARLPGPRANSRATTMPPPSRRLARIARARIAASRNAPGEPDCGPTAIESPLLPRTAPGSLTRARVFSRCGALSHEARTLRGRRLRSKHDLVELRLGVLAAGSAAAEILLALVHDALRVPLAIRVFAIAAIGAGHRVEDQLEELVLRQGLRERRSLRLGGLGGRGRRPDRCLALGSGRGRLRRKLARLQRDDDRFQHRLRVRASRRALVGRPVLAERDRVRVPEAIRVAAIAAVGARHRLLEHLLQLRLIFLDRERAGGELASEGGGIERALF